MEHSNSEAAKFDVVVRRLLSVSHEEIQKRDKEWHKKREQKNKAMGKREKQKRPRLEPGQTLKLTRNS